jgi:hypothetical protein
VALTMAANDDPQILRDLTDSVPGSEPPGRFQP